MFGSLVQVAWAPAWYKRFAVNYICLSAQVFAINLLVFNQRFFKPIFSNTIVCVADIARERVPVEAASVSKDDLKHVEPNVANTLPSQAGMGGMTFIFLRILCMSSGVLLWPETCSSCRFLQAILTTCKPPPPKPKVHAQMLACRVYTIQQWLPTAGPRKFSPVCRISSFHTSCRCSYWLKNSFYAWPIFS